MTNQEGIPSAKNFSPEAIYSWRLNHNEPEDSGLHSAMERATHCDQHHVNHCPAVTPTDKISRLYLRFYIHNLSLLLINCYFAL